MRPLSLVPVTLTLILVPSLSGSLSGKSSTCRTKVQMLNLARVLQSQAPRYRSSATPRRDPSFLVLKHFSQGNFRGRRTTEVPTALSPEARLDCFLCSSLEHPRSPFSSLTGFQAFPEHHCEPISPWESLRSLPVVPSIQGIPWRVPVVPMPSCGRRHSPRCPQASLRSPRSPLS